MRKNPRFRRGQWVTWTDPDADNLMQPHVGCIEATEIHDGNRLYLIDEGEKPWEGTPGEDGKPKMMQTYALVLEEELSPLKQED